MVMEDASQGAALNNKTDSLVKPNARLTLGAVRTHYEPVTEEEKALDKRINLKFDFLVIAILAIDFLLQGIDKSNVGYAAASSSRFIFETCVAP
jgi:hypothetical protein